MKLLILALACLVAIASAQINCQNVGTVVDDFSVFFNAPNGFDRIQVIQGETTTTINTHPITGAAGSFLFAADTFPEGAPGAPNNILGGYRDTIVYINQNSNPAPSPGQGVRMNINNGLDNQGTIRPQLRYSTDQGLFGIGEIQWDGNTDQANPRNFVKTGLGGRDLTLGGSSTAFTLNLVDTDLPLIIRIEAWSYAAGVEANSRGVFLNWNPQQTDSLNLQFTDFAPIGAAVNPTTVFASLGAMRMFITDAGAGTPPEIDLVIFSLSVPNRFCLLKAVASGTATGVDARFNLFTGTGNSLIVSDNCANQFVNVGSRVTFLVQAFIENVSPSTFNINDVLPATLGLVTNSIQVFTHGTSASNLTSTILSTANNGFSIRFNVLQTTTSYITIFFEANVLATAVTTSNCVGIVSNRATLNATGINIESFHYNGQVALNRATRFCVRATPNFILQQTVNVAADETIEPGDLFTITTSYRNNGQITSDAVFLNATFSSNALSFVDTSGWTGSGLTFVRSLGSLPVEAALRTMSAQIRVSDTANEGSYTVTCCIYNQNTELPAFCRRSVCVSITVNVEEKGVPNVKIIKRGHLVRQIEFQIDYFNPCADRATDVVLVDHVPAGTVFNPDLSDERWNCTAAGVCTIDVGFVNGNAAGCGVFVVDIEDHTLPCTVFHNEATIFASNDAHTHDNSDSAYIIEPGCPNRNCYEDCDSHYSYLF